MPALAIADVVAIPSFWEAFPLVALESLALGRAIVATGGTGVDDFITDGRNGLLVAREDSRALADALTGLIESVELRERLGEAGARAAEDFDVEIVARRWAEFLATVGRHA
jgi:glycosyltransferase involved in cell wall biosynthesis